MTPNPLIAELMNHKWAMEESALKAFFEMNLSTLIEEAGKSAAVNKPAGMKINNGIAKIKISGVLLKTVPDWLRYWGIEATGYDEITGQLQKALKNEEVTGIHLQVSSPGGEVDGLAETADMIFAARSEKPVTATIEDLGASAAYWLASQAETIEAGRTAEVGSIGVYTVYADMSKRAEDMGIKVIVIKSGEHKGMGVPGAEITDMQIKAVQEVVDQLADTFISAVAAGRGKKKSEVEGWASGRLWIAKTAQDMGLIDTVTVNTVQNQEGIKTKGKSMEKEKENQEAIEAKAKEQEEKMNKLAVEEAKLEERERLSKLKETFPDDLEFALKAFSEGKSVQEAKAEYCDVLQARIKDVEAKVVKVKVKEKTAGAPPISNEDNDNEGQVSFVEAAKELAKTEKIKLGEAYKRVAREQPELYQAHIAGLGLQRAAVA